MSQHCHKHNRGFSLCDGLHPCPTLTSSIPPGARAWLVAEYRRAEKAVKEHINVHVKRVRRGHRTPYRRELSKMGREALTMFADELPKNPSGTVRWELG